MLTENGIITSRFIPCRDKDSNLFKSESKFKKELKSKSKALGFSLAKPFANFFKKKRATLQMEQRASRYSRSNSEIYYSTVTDFAKFLGWSTLQPRITAMW